MGAVTTPTATKGSVEAQSPPLRCVHAIVGPVAVPVVLVGAVLVMVILAVGEVREVAVFEDGPGEFGEGIHPDLVQGAGVVGVGDFGGVGGGVQHDLDRGQVHRRPV